MSVELGNRYRSSKIFHTAAWLHESRPDGFAGCLAKLSTDDQTTLEQLDRYQHVATATNITRLIHENNDA